MSLLTARIGRLFEGMGFGGSPKEPPGYDLYDLPTLYVRGIPREVVVGEQEVPGEAMGVKRFVKKLLSRCSHVEGMGCGICSDARMVERMVAESGRARCLPAR